MMTDKEVGALWRTAHESDEPTFWVTGVKELIRKLVEERARYHAIRDGGYRGFTAQDIDWACEQFGIDPKSWEKSHD
jgi:hypothetical protein